jgi:hypothetical protein
MKSDWCFFAANPERSYYARLAAAGEIAKFFEGMTLARDCFVYAVIRLRRAQVLELRTLFVVLEPQGGDMDEADAMAAWHAAEDTLMGGHVERPKQRQAGVLRRKRNARGRCARNFTLAK